MCSVLGVSVSGLCYLNVCLIFKCMLDFIDQKALVLMAHKSITVVTSRNMHSSPLGKDLAWWYSKMSFTETFRTTAIQFKQNTETRLPY